MYTYPQILKQIINFWGRFRALKKKKKAQNIMEFGVPRNGYLIQSGLQIFVISWYSCLSFLDAENVVWLRPYGL